MTQNPNQKIMERFAFEMAKKDDRIERMYRLFRAIANGAASDQTPTHQLVLIRRAAQRFVDEYENKK